MAGPGQVRVAVHAAGVNPVDAGNRADGDWAGLRVPCILGYDIAGVIDSVGPGVTSLAPGDRVMAMTHFPDGAGGYAEFAVTDAALVAPIGPATSFTDAAATPVRSEEHTSELQSPDTISYAVFCLNKKKKKYPHILLPSSIH